MRRRRREVGLSRCFFVFFPPLNHGGIRPVKVFSFDNKSFPFLAFCIFFKKIGARRGGGGGGVVRINLRELIN